MYHQLNRVTGRLAAATNLQSPLFPVAPIALQRVEPPTIRYTTAELSTVADKQACAPTKKRLVPGTNVPFPPVPEHIRKLQEKFTAENDIPVFLKGGPMDAVLYRITLALCLVGIIGSADLLYTLAYKK